MRIPSTRAKYHYYALAVLLAANMLNYIDRQVIFAVFPLIKSDLRISDTALGFLGSVFMVCYMVAAPLFGWLGDRVKRIRIAAGGLLGWSLATAAAGIANSYGMLLSARTMVGIGEASFGTVSPTIIADYFAKVHRGRILSLFYLAIPVGSALGYFLGGILGHYAGWHAAFLVVSVPGILLSIPIWFLREPVRGENDGNAESLDGLKPTGYRQLAENRPFLINTLAMAAMTFALGGLAQWVPTFLYRVHNLDVATGNIAFGIVTISAGITGTLAGGWLGDYLQKKSGKGYLLVSGWGFLIGVPITIYSLMTQITAICFAAIFFAEFFLFLSTGPLNTVIVNVTSPAMRSMAFAVNIFFIHALGDAISPILIGQISDLMGLRTALLITPFAILIAGLACFFCMRFIENDIEDQDTAGLR
ncbi:MAG: spinster family MFS transporter [Dissulfurispiraceae bacterium]|jgi:MFS transporter, Spinster family, sphingosine-1-phosphate transporter